MSAFGGKADMRLLPGRSLLTHAASVDCLLYLINRGLRRQGISGRSDRHAVSAVPNEDFERRAIRFSNLSAPPTLLALKRTDFKALIDFGFVHSHSPGGDRHRFASAGLACAFYSRPLPTTLQPVQKSAPKGSRLPCDKRNGLSHLRIRVFGHIKHFPNRLPHLDVDLQSEGVRIAGTFRPDLSQANVQCLASALDKLRVSSLEFPHNYPQQNVVRVNFPIEARYILLLAVQRCHVCHQEFPPCGASPVRFHSLAASEHRAVAPCYHGCYHDVSVVTFRSGKAHVY